MELVGIEVIRDGELIATRAVRDCGSTPRWPTSTSFSANIHRRHLTSEQKDDVTAKLLKAKPEKSNRAIAKLVKRDGKTVAKVRRELERREEIPHVETRTDAKGRKQPARKPRRTEDDFRQDLAAKKKATEADLPRSLINSLEATHKLALRAEAEEMIDEATASMIKPKRPASTAARKKRDLMHAGRTRPRVPAANPIGAAWEAATEAQRVEFSDFYGDEVKARRPPVTVRVEMPVVEKAEPVTVRVETPALPRQNAAEPVTVKVGVPAIKEESSDRQDRGAQDPLPTPEEAAADPLWHPMFDRRGTKS